MGGWLESLFDRIEKLWPFALIEAWESGAKFRAGAVVPVPYIVRSGWKLKIEYRERLTPGIYFAFWWAEHIIQESLATDGLPMPVQSLTTADGKSITVTTTIMFRVKDPLRQHVAVTDFQNSLKDACRIHNARILRRYTWDHLLASREEIQTELRRVLYRILKRWGVRLVDVELTDLVLADQQRNFLSGSVSGISSSGV